MGLNFETGNFQSGTGAAASTVTVTLNTSFVPKVIWLSTSAQPGITAGNNSSYAMGCGTSQDGSTIDAQRAVWNGCIIVDASVCKCRVHNALILMVYTGTSTFAIAGSFSLTSVSSGQFVLTVGTQFAADTTIFYTVWGGTDITNWKIGGMMGKASTGAFTETTLGFRPDIAFFVSTAATANDTQTASATFNFGMTDGTNSALFSSYCADASASSLCGSYQRAAASQNEVLANQNGVASINVRNSFTSFGSSSPWITLNADETNGLQNLIIVLAMKGGRHHVGTYAAAATATTFDVTDGAWTPIGVLAVNPKDTAQSTSDTGTAPGRFGLGATDGTRSNAAAFVGADARAANDRYWNMQSTSLMSLQVVPTSVAAQESFNFTAFLSNGWRGTVVTAAAGQTFGQYYSVAANATSASDRRVIMVS